MYSVENFLQDKKIKLYLILCSVFITNAILAEIVGAKIFSLESTLGFSPVCWRIGEKTYSFNLTAGVLLWPFVFVTSDLINEYYGKRGVRIISFLTAALIAYMFLMIWGITKLVPASFWLDMYQKDSEGNALNINESFTIIFQQGLGIMIGSIVAFLIGQLLDVITFQYVRRMTGARFLWLRATGSTLISQLIDSFVVLLVAFYWFGNWKIEDVLAVCIVNYTYKALVALLMTPILYWVHYTIDFYLGKELAQEMTRSAAIG
ncbi:MAG: queuosine precursor transporter [Cytophagales bacterium]|nr:queuosine precursor transporter [Cytophagales bacterium]MDW8384897.1 queuosine precursor transporter [Flammeovirgaceae bacterium]